MKSLRGALAPVIASTMLLLAGCAGAKPDESPAGLAEPTPPAANPATAIHWTFDTDRAGGLPLETEALSGKWAVLAEQDPPTSPHALCQTGAAEYPALSLRNVTFSDVVLSARVKADAASPEHAAGLLFHAQDPENYYVVRTNLSGGSFGLYKYVNGSPTPVKEVPAQTQQSGPWQEIRVEVVGNQVRGYLNGQLVIEASDDTFKTGRVGLWTTDGADTCFDDVGVRAASSRG